METMPMRKLRLRSSYIRAAHQCARATCARILEGGILGGFLLVMFSNPTSLIGGKIGFIFCNRIFKKRFHAF